MKCLALVCVLVLVFSLSAGEWISVSRSDAKCASKEFVRGNGLSVDFSVPGFEVEKKEINGEVYSKISVPGTSVHMRKGEPELRMISTFIAVPPCAEVQGEIVSEEFSVIMTGPVAPSKGGVPRNVDPETIAFEFGDAYRSGKVYPEQILKVSAPFQMRDVWGVRVSVTPFQYNHAKGTLKVYSKVRVSLNPVGMRKSVSRTKPSSHFENLYEDLFINYRSRTKKALTAPEEKKNLLIIAHDEFVEACQPLKEWKVQQGFDVELIAVSEAGTSAEEIKQYLQKRYDEGKLCFVTLVGDSDHIPTFKGVFEDGMYPKADSDPCYVKLAGNDNVMDAFICRIPADSKEQLSYIIQKTVHYEQHPMQGEDGAWYKKTLAIASFQGSPKDCERTDDLNKALADDLGFTASTCYDTTYWGGADKQVVHDAVNAGVSIINYCGHGGETDWVTSGFSNSDCDQLNNGMKLPVIWSVACVNGAYVGRKCFAEAWLQAGNKEKPSGCIGIAAATTNMDWVPPCVWQKEIIVEQTCKKKHDLVVVQHLYGILKTMEEYGPGDKEYGNMLSEQTHYFGEGTVALRVEAAKRIEASHQLDRGTLTVFTEPGATVSAYNDAYNETVTAVADSNGVASMTVSGQTMYSVTGTGIEPVLDMIF